MGIPKGPDTRSLDCKCRAGPWDLPLPAWIFEEIGPAREVHRILGGNVTAVQTLSAFQGDIAEVDRASDADCIRLLLVDDCKLRRDSVTEFLSRNDTEVSRAWDMQSLCEEFLETDAALDGKQRADAFLGEPDDSIGQPFQEGQTALARI